MREHDDMRAKAEAELGKAVGAFTTETVLRARVVVGDRTLEVTASTGTPLDDLYAALMLSAK